MRKKIKKELFKLFTSELLSCFLFIFCYFIWFKENQIQITYPMTLLCFILLQVSFYWLICLLKLNNNFNSIKFIKIYLVLKYIDFILLLGYIPIILLSPFISNLYYVGSVFLILFTMIEYINYFIVRLSYPKISILIRKITSRKLTKSSLAKDIERIKT